MPPTSLQDNAVKYLNYLCLEIPTRCVGSAGNRQATDFFAQTIASFGFSVDTPSFDCIDWRQDGAALHASGIPFDVQVSPYSLGCQVSGALHVINSLADLEAADLSGQIVLLQGEIAQEQIMPKNFVFYNPDHHKQIVSLLEAKSPLALVAATGRDPSMAGAVYPFPLFEDGDFDIPSVYLTDEAGLRLAQHAGQPAELTIRAERRTATGCNVVARKGAQPHRRVVLFAHIDAKQGTPGALDNAAGITTLLLLAELLQNDQHNLGVEIVALNGEDHYSAAGEMLFLSQNQGRFADMTLGVNLDGLGYRHGKTAFSLYGCSPELAQQITAVFTAYPGLVEGESWYQSDHGLFIMNEVPALALTSSEFTPLWMEIAHTAKDTPDLVEPARLVEAASALRALVFRIDQA